MFDQLTDPNISPRWWEQLDASLADGYDQAIEPWGKSSDLLTSQTLNNCMIIHSAFCFSDSHLFKSRVTCRLYSFVQSESESEEKYDDVV